MKSILCSLGLISALIAPELAQAAPVTLTTQLKNYGGDGAYLAIYITSAQGEYQETLWVSGKKSKYYKHLRDWARGSKMAASEFDGMSGASVGAGRTLKVTVELADKLIDAGYEIRIDTAVEDGRDNPAEVRVPLTTEGAGKVWTGRVYVQSFTYQLQ